MKTFEEYLRDESSQHGGVNLLFESGFYNLMDDLQCIVTVLRSANIEFEVIGGVAVNAHLMQHHPKRVVGTLDIDLLVQRHDLERIVAAAQKAGYNARKIVGGHMLIRPGQAVAEAVHMIFTGEKPKSTAPFPNPQLDPEEKHLPQLGITIPVAALKDLVQLKLNSFRAKDEAHVELLDRCGLITKEIEEHLPPVLKARLEHTRQRYMEDFDGEVE